MRKFFGTDGIRGRTNVAPMTADTAMRVGQAAGAFFLRGDHRHRVVIGKDTRLSGYMMESAMVAGFTSVGMDVILVGPMPTPAVAMLTKELRADLGVMLQLPPEKLPEVSGAIEVMRSYTLPALLDSAARRPQLQAQDLREQAARSRLELERAAAYPDVTLGVTTGREGTPSATDSARSASTCSGWRSKSMSSEISGTR